MTLRRKRVLANDPLILPQTLTAGARFVRSPHHRMELQGSISLV
jgi:hypothetical protein